MKKISLFALANALVFCVNAQNVDIGLKGGLNLSTIDNSQSANFNNRLGYNAGLLFNIPINSQIAIQPEVVYSSQGAKYTVADFEHSLALNYINLPLMFQVNAGRGFYAQAGPQLGFLTGVKDETNDIETGFFTSDDFKKTDVSIGVGLGYKTISGIGVDARYNLGLSNINDVGTNNLKNNVLQIGLFLNLSGRR